MMKKIVSFKEYVNNLKEAEDITDNKPESEITPSDTDKKADSVNNAKPKQADKEDTKETTSVPSGKWYTAPFSLRLSSDTDDGKMLELKTKCSMLMATNEQILNMFKNDTDHDNSSNNTNKEDIGVPIRILKTSMTRIRNNFTKWADEELSVLKKKYHSNRDTAAALGSSISSKEELDRITNIVNNESVSELENTINEALSDIFSKGNIFKSTNDYVMGKNKYNANAIMQTLKKFDGSGKKDPKTYVYNLKNNEAFDKIDQEFENRGRVVINRGQKEIRESLAETNKKIDSYIHYSSYIKNTQIYISTVESELYNAWGKIKSLASSLNTILESYQNTINEVKREFIRQFNASEANIHGYNAKVDLKNRTDEFINSEKAKADAALEAEKKKKANEEREALKNAKKSEQSQLEIAKAESETAAKKAKDTQDADDEREREAERAADRESSSKKRASFIATFKDSIKDFKSLDGIAKAAERLENGEDVGLGKDVDDGIKAKVLYALYVFNNRPVKEISKIDNSSKKIELIGDFARNIWDNDISEKDSSELLKAINKDDKEKDAKVSSPSRANKIKVSEAKFLSKYLPKINSAISTIKNKFNNNAANNAVRFAKDFDGEAPKNIFDYAVEKARRNKEM